MKQIGYIGLDVGTSGCKAAIVNENGKILASARRVYTFERPAKGMVELNPVTVWKEVQDTLTEIAALAGKLDCELRMLSVSSIGEAMVALDETDQVLHNGITYLDVRGEKSIPEIREKISRAELQRITGLPERAYFSLPGLLWLRKNKPQVLEKAVKYCMFGDYMAYMLTGERGIDPSTASKTQLLNTRTLDWAYDVGEIFEMPLERFPKVVTTGSRLGKIRPAIARQTGLPKSLIVLIGAHDQSAATLGSGGISSGDMILGEGSSEGLNLVIHKDELTDEYFDSQLALEPYIIPEHYLIPGGVSSHGTAIRWFVKQFGVDFSADDNPPIPGVDVYDQANKNCAQDSGEIFFLPYLTRANVMDPDNKSLGIFLGLELDSSRSRMYRALLEGLSFETMASINTIEDLGYKVKTLTAVGGSAKSELFMQIKADVLRKNITILDNPDAGISGMAMICAVADGMYDSYKEARPHFVHAASVLKPQKDYEEKYWKYLEIRLAAKELYNIILNNPGKKR